MRGCLHAVKLEREGKRSKASLKNDPDDSPVFLQNNHACPDLGKIRHDHRKYIHENPE